MATVHQPPGRIDIPTTRELFFFAGPIQGAPDWQNTGIAVFGELSDRYPKLNDADLANPRRTYMDGTFDYEAQVTWERRALRRAADCGGVVFWFAAQDHSLPYEQGRAYAQTTKIELGRVLGWRDYDPTIAVAIGIEPGYEGGNERYIRSAAAEQGLQVYTELGITCAALVATTRS
jgi:hypothetical protein